jgi:hypothetical protein
MADYVRHGACIRRLTDGALIPVDEDNADYRIYLRAAQVDPAAAVDHADWVALEELRLHARSVIDAEAETARLRYVTPGAGQAMTYQDKRAQALAYVAAGEPEDLTPYPFLAAEASALGVTASAAATAILDTSALWAVVGAQIEGIRMGGKRAATEAASRAAVMAAQQSAVESLRAV